MLADAAVSVPIRHAVSRLVPGPASPVQSAALPIALSGQNLLAVAPTGTGKTLVFAIAAAHQLAGAPSRPGRPRALVLAPTRELAIQNAEVVATTGAGLKTAVFTSGVKAAADRRSLAAPVDVAIATPGKLTELLRSGEVSAKDVELVVLDEADRLLEDTFASEMERILNALSETRLIAVTATASDECVTKLKSRWPSLAIVQPADTTSSLSVGPARKLFLVEAPNPLAVAALIAPRCSRGLFFVGRRMDSVPLRSAIAGHGVAVAGITGEATARQRTEALSSLRSGRVQVLVTTDLVGRGLDIEEISHVIHVGVPHSVEDLIHRTGRTGRGLSRTGIVAALVEPSHVERMRRQAETAGLEIIPLNLSTQSFAEINVAAVEPVLRQAFGSVVVPSAPKQAATTARERPRSRSSSRVHRPKRTKKRK